MKKKYLSTFTIAILFIISAVFYACNSNEDTQKDAQNELNEMMKGVEEAVKNIDTATVLPNMDDTTKKVDKTNKEIK